MKQLCLRSISALTFAVAVTIQAAETKPAPDFKEVYSLIRGHLPGTSETDLNRAAVDGLLSNLKGKVTLIGDESKSTGKTNDTLVTKAVVFDEEIGYLRVNRVLEGLAPDVRTAFDQMKATNKIKGLALDLRFAEGDSYAAAAAVADLFASKEIKLLDWGDGMAKSKEKKNAIGVPVAVLVNRDTVGAAEAVAAVLRDTAAGLILGSPTAGGAMTGKDYPLENGQRLRIAASPVKLGDGSEIPTEGVKPDIEVAVSRADELVYFADPYAMPSATPKMANDITASSDSSVRPQGRRFRPSEADLVRARREGRDLEELLASERDSEKPTIRDPALARAVDVLKGLAVVRRSRS
jgi:C-terminal processing protease CtpA/Prc